MEKSMLFNRLNVKCQVKTHSRYKEFVYGSKLPENDTQDDETDTDA